MLPTDIFKAYDIRGIVGKTLTADVVKRIGQGLGTLAYEAGCTAIAVGRDGRLSGPNLSQALMQGIQLAGIDSIDIGAVPTPVSYFAAHHLNTHCAVSVTGSHNPPEYNGLKMVIGGTTLSGTAIQTLRQRIESKNIRHHPVGTIKNTDVIDDYIQRITRDIKLARPLKIVIDAGNGIAGHIAPTLFRAIGCEVIELFCEVDGLFPNHHPDPSKPENLVDLKNVIDMHAADLGLAFDGDGDRLGVVTRQGNIIYPDRQLLLFAAHVLAQQPGATILYDVKCTRNLDPWIRQHGGIPEIWKTGHSLIKARLKETGAALAGEMSGHVFFNDRWYGFDDGLYAGARLLEIVSQDADPSATLDALPDSLCTPEINIALQEGEAHTLIEGLQQYATFPEAIRIITIDGLRVEYADGFGLVRASNTTPVLVLRFEADNANALHRIQTEFLQQLQHQKPGISFQK